MAAPKKKAAAGKRATVGKDAVAVEPLPEPDEKQRGEIEEMRERQAKRRESPRSKLTIEDGVLQVTNDLTQPRDIYNLASMEATGTSSQDFHLELLRQLTEALGKNGVTDRGWNAALAVLTAVQPDNEVEALLAAQMIAAHGAALRCAAKITGIGSVEEFQLFGGLSIKFMRTFTAQMEALSKMRRGGEQIVRHVHVYEGGQAVVADTIHQHRGGGGTAKDGGQSDTTNAIAGSAALPSPDPSRDGVSVPGDAERPLSHARRDKSGSSEGKP